jgi:hypothetical protein
MTVPSSSHSTTSKSRFPIPVSIHDLEREPYNLLPYPNDFEDDNDDETRTHSFQKLVQYIEQGNRCLSGNHDGLLQMNLFLPSTNDEEDIGEEEPWMDESRIQALYTLVRYVSWMVRCDSHPSKIYIDLCSHSTRR